MRVKLKLVIPTVYVVPDTTFNILKFDLDRLRNTKSKYCKNNVLRYIQSGSMGGITFDWISDPYTGEDIGPSNGYTDGVWFWQETLIYYVQKYGIHLPTAFLSHMEKCHWDCQVSRNIFHVSEEHYLLPYRILNNGEIDMLVNNQYFSRGNTSMEMLFGYEHGTALTTHLDDYKHRFKKEVKEMLERYPNQYGDDSYLCTLSNDYYD